MKGNLFDRDAPTALALSAGIGAAASPTSDGGPWSRVASLPVSITASRSLIPGRTPYGAISYTAYWIFGYGSGGTPHPAGRTGTGDGLLGLHAGLELAASSGRAILFEYVYSRPVVDDPGDRYAFAANQFFMIGFHTGGPTR